MGDGEGDLLLPFEVIRGRAAFQIDRAVRNQRDAGGRGDRVELGLERGKLERILHPIDDAGAQIHSIAHDLLLVVVIGKRHRGLAVPERDRARILDLLERARELLRERWAPGQDSSRNQREQHFETHRFSPL
jgi:hypothetical protein